MTSTEAPFSVAGPTGDFAEFYATNRDDIGRTLALTLNNTALGYEAVDEAMTRAYQRWADIAEGTNPQGWVYRVGLNWARSWQRRLSTAARKLPAVAQQEALRSQIFAISAAPTEDDAELALALASLPHHQRAVVVLRFHLDWSVEEVADVLAISPGTVKSRLHRALTTMRSDLQPETDTDPAVDRRKNRVNLGPILTLPDDRLSQLLERTARTIEPPPPSSDPAVPVQAWRSSTELPGVIMAAVALLLLVPLGAVVGAFGSAGGALDAVQDVLPGSVGQSDTLPVLEQAVWDGAQFVINDNALLDDDAISHWTSPDGIEWKRHDGPSMAGWERRCYPGFPCDIEPQDAANVPFHFSEAVQSVAAIREDTSGSVALVEVWTQYHPFLSAYDEDGEQYPGPGTIHPDVGRAAAAHSSCFSQAVAEAPEFSRGPDGAFISSWGTASSTQSYITMMCELEGESQTFRLTLDDKLTDQQLHWLAAGGERQLFAVRPDGQVQRVSDPPSQSFWSDGIPNVDLVTSLSDIAATSARFWSVDDGVVVSSTDGVEWDPIDIDLDGKQATQVVAGLGGDIAVLAVDDHQLSWNGSKVVVFSHDDGQSWSQPVAIDHGDERDEGDEGDESGVRLNGVSPAGVAFQLSTPEGDEMRVVSDRGPAADFGLAFPRQPAASWVAIGDEQVLVPRELRDPNGLYAGEWILEVYNTSGQLVATVAE